MMDDSNISSQADEIAALGAIFDKDFAVVDEAAREFEITIVPSTTQASNDDYRLTLKVHFPDGYPLNCPPVLELYAPWLRGALRHQFIAALNDLYAEHIGESVVYESVEKLRELVTEYLETRDVDTQEKEDEDSWHVGSSSSAESSANSSPVKSRASDDIIPLPEIFSSESMTDRRSVFQAHLAKISHVQQVDMVLNKLKENKKIAVATHNIVAYRLVLNEERGTMIQGNNDDGEHQASNRMLHLMQIIDARNVLVIVTRWYGGVHLGPDRFKHINNMTREILEEHGFIREKSDSKAKQGKSSRRK